MSQPPLNAVRAFVAAARRLSFQGAARELCVTPGAVSRQIQALEAHLGVALFERRHRAVALTQLGALYLAQCGPALDAIDTTSRRVRELARNAAGARRAVVRLDATPTFAMHWLIPRLAEFRAQHPAIEVRLGTSQEDIVRSADVDLHIRRDPAHFGGLEGKPFMREYAALVCSPRLRDWQTLTTPEKILGAPLVRMRSRPDLWPKWLARCAATETHAGPLGAAAQFTEFDNTILAIQAVVEGLGVGLIPELFIAELRQGARWSDCRAANPSRPAPTTCSANGPKRRRKWKSSAAGSNAARQTPARPAKAMPRRNDRPRRSARTPIRRRRDVAQPRRTRRAFAGAGRTVSLRPECVAKHPSSGHARPAGQACSSPH